MKIDRHKVYKKFDGHCAYCGGELDFKRMQVDHLWPQHLCHHEPDLDNDRFENLMPACQPCNIHKHGMKLEVWRGELGRQLSMLMKNAQFKRVLKFRQVKITERPIVFYFENYYKNIK